MVKEQLPNRTKGLQSGGRYHAQLDLGIFRDNENGEAEIALGPQCE